MKTLYSQRKPLTFIHPSFGHDIDFSSINYICFDLSSSQDTRTEVIVLHKPYQFSR